MSTIRHTYGVASNVSSEQFIAGMECEIESLAGTGVDTTYWTVVNDGSLRNHGYEFVSRPLDKKTLIQAFTSLHGHLSFHNTQKAIRFSPRTSIHVHVNCLDLEESQVRSIILWYALFEEVFFALANPVRQNNIHCVKLNQTMLPLSYGKDLTVLTGRWHKYTALNILPLKTFGTIEFRHMHGTDCVETVSGWLNALENLWTFGKDVPISKDAILSTESLQKAFVAIFRDTPEAMKYEGQFLNLVSDSLIDVKLSFL